MLGKRTNKVLWVCKGRGAHIWLLGTSGDFMERGCLRSVLKDEENLDRLRWAEGVTGRAHSVMKVRGEGKEYLGNIEEWRIRDTRGITSWQSRLVSSGQMPPRRSLLLVPSKMRGYWTLLSGEVPWLELLLRDFRWMQGDRVWKSHWRGIGDNLDLFTGQGGSRGGKAENVNRSSSRFDSFILQEVWCFWSLAESSKVIKEKVDIFNYIKIKNAYMAKNAINRVKRQGQTRENICNINDKGLIS